MTNSDPANIFDLEGGLPDPLPAEPMSLLGDWFEEARRSKRVPNPNAMMLATSTLDGRPSARVVLCKALDVEGATLFFYTNHESRKGRELAANPRVACVFHWDHADRQARIEGVVGPATDAESDKYFASRPLLSKLGAWTSRQSAPLARRSDLLGQLEQTIARFGLTPAEVAEGTSDKPVPRPPNWGGFRIRAESVELWQGVRGRLHDRAVWKRPLTTSPGGEGGIWTATRLQP